MGYSVKDLIFFSPYFGPGCRARPVSIFANDEQLAPALNCHGISFGDKALLSMNIDALVAWNPECSVQDLEERKGDSIIASAWMTTRCLSTTLSHEKSD